MRTFYLCVLVFSSDLSGAQEICNIHRFFIFFFKQKTAYEMRISDWSSDVCSSDLYVCDIAQLVHQLELKPLTIIGHSLGGAITLRYTGLFPETVVKAVAIEGLGWSADKIAAQSKSPTHERLVKWLEEMRKLPGRIPRRYAPLAEAVDRMPEANPNPSPDQAQNLTA